MQLDQSDINHERHKQRRLEALGTDNPCCCECGNTDWYCLELHHIAGKDYDDATCIICRNCHAGQHFERRDHPTGDASHYSLLNRICQFMFGLAALLRTAADRLNSFAHELSAWLRQEAMS